MGTQFIDASVCGASHKRSGTECQDSYRFIDKGDVLILVVADGHGSAACPHSKSGSEIAVNVFCESMSAYCDIYSDDLNALLTFFHREGDTTVAKSIDTTWKQRILEEHSNQERDIEPDETQLDDGWKEKIYTLYGTTLAGLLITPLFRFAFQLGDGDMVFISESGVLPLLETDKILGVEVHSLSKKEAWEKAVTAVQRLDNSLTEPYAYMLTTDGFANSYPNEEEYREAAKGYFDTVKEHGCNAVNENLNDWLWQTSEQGCGDDITLLMAYFGEKQTL